MDVLEQMQRRGAAAVEELDVGLLRLEQIGRGELVGEGVQGPACGARQRLVRIDGGANRVHRIDQIRGRVGEQRGEGAQGQRSGHHALSLIGMIFFLPPKRLVSVAPSEQPLPNEKPQPPRRSYAFSAYSRCVVGMTKRSS